MKITKNGLTKKVWQDQAEEEKPVNARLVKLSNERRIILTKFATGEETCLWKMYCLSAEKIDCFNFE